MPLGGEIIFFSSRISRAERMEVRLTRYSSAKTRSGGSAAVHSPSWIRVVMSCAIWRGLEKRGSFIGLY